MAVLTQSQVFALADLLPEATVQEFTDPKAIHVFAQNVKVYLETDDPEAGKSLIGNFGLDEDDLNSETLREILNILEIPPDPPRTTFKLKVTLEYEMDTRIPYTEEEAAEAAEDALRTSLSPHRYSGVNYTLLRKAASPVQVKVCPKGT